MVENLITPELPYAEKFNTAYLSIRKRDNRRYIHFYNTETFEADDTSYARYLFQVNYWKKHQKLIPDGYHVDHINDDCTDDRLENYQLLTIRENNLKRDAAGYKRNPISTETLHWIEAYLKDGLSYQFIYEKFDLTPGHLRYIVRTWLPELDQYSIIKLNIEDIKELLNNDISQYIIAEKYGVDQATISRYIADHLPEYTQNAILSRKLAVIRDGLVKQETLRSIGKKLGCLDSNISYYIKTYFPGHTTTSVQINNEQQLESVQKIKALLEKDLNQQEIADMLNLSSWQVWSLIDKYLPEYKDISAYDLRVRKVGELLEQNKSAKEIAEILNQNPRSIYNTINQHYPEKTTDELRAEKLVEFKSLVESDNHTLSQISEILDIGYVTICQWLKIHFPERHAAYRTLERKQKILEHINTNPGLSNLDLAIQTDSPYFFVTTVLQKELQRN